MNLKIPTQDTARNRSFTPVQSRLLQRQCGCGKSRSEQCYGCQSKQSSLYTKSSNWRPTPPILHEMLNSPEQPLDLLPANDYPPVPQGETTGACVPPSTIRFVRPYRVEFPSYGTGGGICAVMEVQPTSNLCINEVREEVTPASSGSTCPASLIAGGCTGDSTFPLGRGGRLCREIPIPATGFADRHTVQVRTSVLHDSTRNPANLDRCTSICHQRYYSQTGTTQTALGRFQIRYDFQKGVRDGQDVTFVTALKTSMP